MDIEKLINQTASELSSPFSAAITESLSNLKRDTGAVCGAVVNVGGRKPRITPEVRTAIIEAVKSGSSYGGAAGRFRVSDTHVERLCRKAGVKSAFAGSRASKPKQGSPSSSVGDAGGAETI